jgi:hypothetical protein
LKRLVFASLFALVTLTGPRLSAQTPFLFPNPPWCPTCFVAAHLDAPLVDQVTPMPSTPNTYAAGWAFECQSGALPDRYRAYFDPDGNGATELRIAVYNQLPRADVVTHFAAVQSGCNPPSNTGFHVYFLDGLPIQAGQVGLLSVTVWHQSMFHVQRRYVTLADG